jgi:hypothetical protein
MNRMNESCLWSVLLRVCFALTALSVDCMAGPGWQKAVASIAVADVQLRIASERPALPDSANRFSRSMSMTIPGTTATTSDTIAAQLIIGVWRDGCPACRRLEKDLRQTLVPLGWTIGQGSTDQIRFVEVPGSEAVPQIVLLQNGIERKRWSGYRDPAFLSNELRRAWDQAMPQSSVTAVGRAGTIHAASQIRQLLSWFRDSIGEGVRAELRWDRSGTQSFPLLAKGDWSALALFGGYGHIQLSALGAKNLPVPSLGFGYRVDRDDITFDIDPVTMKGLASWLGPDDGQTKSTSQSPNATTLRPNTRVPEAGLITIWTVFSIVRDLWSLLHPSCDLQLGGNVSAAAVLSGDELAIEFQQCPSIRFVALFTFHLSVKRVVITQSNVHVEFGGSRIIQSRDFEVQ